MSTLIPLRGCPREQRLRALYRENADFVAALSGIAGLHRGTEEVTLRTRWTEHGRRPAAHPDDIQSLLWVLLRRVLYLTGACEGPRDDLLLAAFLMDGIGDVQPFDGANARIAMDLAVYVLMQRWGVERPPVAFDATADRVLDAVFQAKENPPARNAFERFTLVTTLSRRFAGAEMAELRANASYQALADWLANAMGLDAPEVRS